MNCLKLLELCWWRRNGLLIPVGFAEILKSIGFFRKVFPMWLVLWNDNLSAAECISAEIILSIITPHADLPPDPLPVLSCFVVARLWVGEKWRLAELSWAEEAIVEGAEKELARFDGGMASRSWVGLWDIPSIISLR